MNLYKSTNKKLIFVKTCCGDSTESITKNLYNDLCFSSLIFPEGNLKGVIIVRMESSWIESRYYVLVDEKNCLSINAKSIREEIRLNRRKEDIFNQNNKKHFLLQEQRPMGKRRKRRQRQRNEQLTQDLLMLKARKLFDEFLQAGVLSKITEPMLPEEKKIATLKSIKKSDVDLYRFWIP